MKGFDVKQLLREAEKMQKQIQTSQEALESVTVEGSSGGGAVRIVCNGNGKIMSVKIDREFMSTGDQAMLEDLILSAIHNAVEMAEKVSNDRMKEVTGGSLPFKSPKR